MSRCACGYAREDHDPSGHCPLCACGATPAEHVLAWTVHPPMLKASTEARCPGKPQRETGKWLTMRRGSFRLPEPPAALVELYHGIRVPLSENELKRRAAEAVDEHVVAEPLVSARLTVALDEIAPRARPLGTLAADLGWTVVPYYWQAGDGTETSALLLHRGDLRAAAYWHRAPGASWRTGGAWGWQVGAWPAKVGVTALTNVIKEMGRDDHQEG
jgi:hypothetical protein